MKASTSLTVLEMLVYLNPALHFKYLIFSIEFDAFVVKKPPAGLPAGWRDESPPPSTKRLGDS